MDPSQENTTIPSQLRSSPVLMASNENPPNGGAVPVVAQTISQSDINKFKKQIMKALGVIIQSVGKEKKIVTAAHNQNKKDKIRNSQASALNARRQILHTGLSAAKGLQKSQEDLNALALKVATGFAMGDQEAILDFVRKLRDDFGIEMPATGAFWAGKSTGQVAAKNALADRGKILADTTLGKAAAGTSFAPQGPKSGETYDDFASRNKEGLMFWGAVSSAYAECMTGDVHIYLPKGITMGSMFWNDELPALWERKRAGEVKELYFHLATSTGWSEAKRFEDLGITSVYATSRDGVHRGAVGIADAQRGTVDSASYEITLNTPVRIGVIKEGLQRWHDRAVIKAGLQRWHDSVIANRGNSASSTSVE